MTLTRDEQHALLRIERLLRKDPSLRAEENKFNRRCPRGKEPVYESLSPWRPLMWRLGFIAVIVLIAGFAALGVALTFHAA